MRISVAALAAAVALSGLVAAPARADVTQPSGDPCSFRAVGPGEYQVTGGPLLLADEDDPTVVHPGTITCSVQSTGAGSDHTATPWFTATSPPGTGVAYLPPVTATYPGPLEDRHYVCSRADVAGQTLYWHYPGDRNADGWWATSPSAPCVPGWTTLDTRLTEDRPYGYAFSAAFAAAGEVGAFSLADQAVCADPAVAAAAEWRCGQPTDVFAISFVRAAGAAVLRTEAPAGWSCTDVHSGLAVGRGSPLTVPDPGVTCAVLPGADPVTCDRVQLSGVLAPATLGRVTMTNACGDLAVTRTFAPGAARAAELWSRDFGRGAPPVRCSATEDTHTGAVAYVAICNYA